MSNVIDFTPFQILGQLEEVLDCLQARIIAHYLDDDILLLAVERLRELHQQLDGALQRQRDNERRRLI